MSEYTAITIYDTCTNAYLLYNTFVILIFNIACKDSFMKFFTNRIKYVQYEGFLTK